MFRSTQNDKNFIQLCLTLEHVVYVNICNNDNSADSISSNIVMSY